MPRSSSDTIGSRFMLIDTVASALARYPTDGQGGATAPGAGPTGSMLLGSRKVIITGLWILTGPTADSTVYLVDNAGVDLPNAGQPLMFLMRSAVAAERGHKLDIEIDEGFGVRLGATDLTGKFLISFRPVL